MERMNRCVMAFAAAISAACLVALSACTIGDLPMREGIEDLGLTWKQVASFSGDTTAPGDEYGLSVSICDDWAAVGCPGETIGLNAGAGAVYLYQKQNGSWQRMQKLSGSILNGYFGRAVALSSSRLLVGAIGENGTKGAAHLFEQSGGSWGTPITLTAPGGVAGDYFGMAVALSDSWAFIGAPFADSSKGTAYAFNKDQNGIIDSWGAPDNAVELASALPVGSNYFGTSLAVCGTYAVIGAPQDTLPPTPGPQGVACVYYYNGSQWGASGNQPTVTLTVTGAKAFGASVSIFGDTIVVGSPGTESAYVYTRSGTAWNPTRVFDPDSASGYLFGSAVSISSQGAIIGAMYDSGMATRAGRGYAFAPYGTGWLLDQKFTAAAAASNALFGQAVSVSDDRAIIGAYGNDVIPGRVCILEKN